MVHLIAAFLLMSHAAKRTIPQWVEWAQGEGMVDIVESENPGNPLHFFPCVVIPFIFRQSVLPIVWKGFGTKCLCTDAALLWEYTKGIHCVRREHTFQKGKEKEGT